MLQYQMTLYLVAPLRQFVYDIFLITISGKPGHSFSDLGGTPIFLSLLNLLFPLDTPLSETFQLRRSPGLGFDNIFNFSFLIDQVSMFPQTFENLVKP